MHSGLQNRYLQESVTIPMGTTTRMKIFTRPGRQRIPMPAEVGSPEPPSIGMRRLPK